MQPTETFSVPRRSLDVEDYIDILRRHKGWIFGPFLLTLVVSVVGVYLWPDSYVSTAAIKVTPQQISPLLIPDVSNQDLIARIDTLYQEVRSRGELTNLIRSLNLYPREKAKMAPEDLLDLMRNNIRLSFMGNASMGGRSVAAFSISFTYPNRFDANKVVQALVSKFIDDSVHTRDTQTFQQMQFIAGQAEESKKKLDDIEGTITEFKLANPGKLPDQMGSNLAAMQSAQSSIWSLSTSMSNARNEKLALENHINILKSQASDRIEEGKAVNVATSAKNSKLAVLENTIESKQALLMQMKVRYTDSFSGVRDLKTEIEQLQKQLDELREKEEAKKPEETVTTIIPNLQTKRELSGINAQVSYAESQIKLKDIEIANLEKQQRDIQATLNMLQSRVQSMPVGDQKFAEMLREERMAQEQYQSDEAKLRAARTANEIENRKQGETLELLDPPSVPQEPSYPNRPSAISMGAGLGLVLGLVLAGAREMKDSSLKNLKDVRAYTQMAILGSIPLLENDFVVRRRRRVAWLGWTVACLVAALLMAGAVTYYFWTR
jgi:polysaccharide chain length determinant protein (PEP-CTERM system associated)